MQLIVMGAPHSGTSVGTRRVHLMAAYPGPSKASGSVATSTISTALLTPTGGDRHQLGEAPDEIF